MDRDRPNDVRHGAGHGVGHGAAHAEALAEDARLVDTNCALELGDQLARELDVSSARVRPAVADPLGRDENRGPVGRNGGV